MKANSLAQTNPHLKNSKTAQRMIIRSLASSTAIETGEPIAAIEKKIIQLRSVAAILIMEPKVNQLVMSLTY